MAELKSVLGLPLLAWLITDINGISHANLILRIRHVCVFRVPLTKFAMFVQVCACEAIFVRFRAFTLRFGAFGSNSQTHRETDKVRERQTEA